MNLQNLMREAQKMQKELQKTQEELSNTEYEGISSLVKIVLDGNKSMKSISIDKSEDFSSDDIEMLEDMILVAFNEAAKKVDSDKEKKLGKYGQGLSGLM